MIILAWIALIWAVLALSFALIQNDQPDEDRSPEERPRDQQEAPPELGQR